MNIDYSKLKSIYSFNDGVFDGGLIKDTLDSRKMMSSFIYHISASCKTKYGKIFDKTWGFAWPSNAKRCLRKMGYNNVKLHWGYDEDKVLKSLENGCPIFISATSKVINGHAWVIDGYIKRFYKQNPDSALKSQTLVHCNWGWGGLCNGYFISGVFKPKDVTISDNLGTTESEDKYWSLINYITYDKPGK